MIVRHLAPGEHEVHVPLHAHVDLYVGLRHREERYHEPALASVRLLVSGRDVTEILDADPKGRAALAELVADLWAPLVDTWLEAVA